ncbi:DUF1801 domain-containing protein [Chloroflexota bacterium]
MNEKTVDGYIKGLEKSKGKIVSTVRKIILEAAPQAKESIKWAQPVYESNGPFAYIKAFKNDVNFGFWRGVDIKDAKGLLQGSGDKMRHVKLSGLDDIDKSTFADFVRQSIELNKTKGDPTKGG